MLASLLVLAAPVWAQDSDDKDEEVFELSPFSVSAEGNVGYRANNTLAGTRLNTQLKDVASAVQVVTKEFLDDVGAVDLGELLTYTTGTEAAGPSGNASFGELNSGTERGERARREPQLNTRVRGLAAADLARDYFISDVAFDPYITSQVTINRGPNASLFGLGSPGGIINSTIDRAITGRTFGEVNLKWNEYGSFRKSLNYNMALIEDKLAIRIALLDSEKRYEQKNAKYDETRRFFAATWRPFGNLNIGANYESGDGDGVRPKLRPPTDRISTWFANGKPSYNPNTHEWFKDGELVTDNAYAAELTRSSTQFGSQGINGNPYMIFDDPNSSIPGNNGYAVVQGGFRKDAAGRIRGESIPATGHAYMRMFQGPRALFARNPDYIVGARPDILPAERGFYSDVQITDLDIINIREGNLTGENGFHRQNFEVYSARAENTWFDNALGLELAFQNQYWGSDLAEAQTASSASTVNIDINTVLMDGSTNPNYGRPFIGGRGYAQAKIRERESVQAIGFGKYDFEDKSDGWLKHLGNHTLTAVVQSQENSETAPNRMNAKASNDWNPSTARRGPGITQAQDYATSSRSNNNTRGIMVQYLGPSLLGASSLQNSGIQGVTVPQKFQSSDNALLWNPFNGAFEPGSAQFYNANDHPDQVWTWGNPLAADEIDSFSSVLQSKFLGGNIVTTASWRSDSVKQFTAAQAQDPATGLYIQGAEIPLGDPTFEEDISQSSFGIVGHVPDQWLPEGFGLSAHFVDSSNIAAGTAGVDMFNVSAPLQGGTTKEYGFSVSALDSKFYARINFFESAQNDAKITGTLPQIGGYIRSVMENNTPAQLAAAGWDLYDGSTFDPGTIVALNIRPADTGVPSNETTWLGDNIAGTPTNYYQDTTSKGMEMEFSYAPTTNWRFHLNVSQVEAQINDVMPISGPELTRVANEVFLDARKGNLFVVADPIPEVDGSYDPEVYLSSRADNLLGAIASKKAPEGGPLQEIREWRTNLVTNYTFNEDSMFSGFSIGSGIRWQDEVAIGSELKIVDGSTVPDYDKLHFGPAETNVDAWVTYNTKVFTDKNLQLQMRIRNLTSGSGDFIPIKANPDGEVALWRIGAPRYLELSARFRF
jgi:outer membrane receptor protein involved in Fe transport